MGYYIDNPNGGDPIYVEGYSPEMAGGSTRGKHTGFVDQLKFISQNIDPRKSALPYALALPALASFAAPSALPSLSTNTLNLSALPGSTATGIGVAPSVAGTTAGVSAGTKSATSLLPKLNKGFQVADAIGQGLGAVEQARGLNRLSDNADMSAYDAAERQRAQLELQKAQADLQRRQYQSDEYQRNARNSVYGGYLSGVQDVNVQAPDGIPMGTVTGGLRPSAITNKDQIGEELQRRALMQMMNPDALPDLPDIPKTTLPQRRSGADTALSAINAGTSFLPLLSDIFRRTVTPKPALPTITNPSPYAAFAS